MFGCATNNLKTPVFYTNYYLRFFYRFNSVSSFYSENLRHNLTPPDFRIHSRKIKLFAPTREKLFIDTENAFAFNNLPPLDPQFNTENQKKPNLTLEQFEQILDHNFRLASPQKIVETFEIVKNYSIENQLALSDPRFDKLIDGLMDNCEKLTDDELFHLLKNISEYPPCESINSHNYHDLWSCLDDICCWKMGCWDIDKKFAFANIWYKLNLGRVSDYIFEVLDGLPSKSKRLSKKHLLYTYFYVNICRKKQVDFNFEHALLQQIKKCNIDELGIVSMAYFKSQSKIKLRPILSELVKAAGKHSSTIHEITLTSILKAVRYSQHFDMNKEIGEMLDKMVPELDRLSDLALIHVALIGTSIQYKHESTLKRCSQRIINNIENIRIKDVERILLANAMFDHDPQTQPDFYQTCHKELHKSERRKEIVQYKRCLPSALNYLSLRGIYSYELMNDVLNERYIDEVYGKNPKLLPRELFSLDACIDVECPWYGGNRLSPLKKYKAAKWLTEFTPSHEQYTRLNASDKFYLDVVDCLGEIVGGGHFVGCDHILPHFTKSGMYFLPIFLLKNAGFGVGKFSAMCTFELLCVFLNLELL